MATREEIEASIGTAKEALSNARTAIHAALEGSRELADEESGRGHHGIATSYLAAVSSLEEAHTQAAAADSAGDDAAVRVAETQGLSGGAGGGRIRAVSDFDGAGRPTSGPTRPSLSPDPARRPGGQPARAHPTRLRDRPLRRENEVAEVLASHGYQVDRNPPPRTNRKRPDYLVEGEFWDCYAPVSDNPDQLRHKIKDKVLDRNGNTQSARVVLCMDDCSVGVEELRRRLTVKPIKGLKELKIVRNGQITNFYPW